MLAKYNVEFTAPLKKQTPTTHYTTDDPVACVEFVEELLVGGFHIKAIQHDGLDLPRHDFDKMIRTAAGLVASKSICASLNISAEEEHSRFGFTA